MSTFIVHAQLDNNIKTNLKASLIEIETILDLFSNQFRITIQITRIKIQFKQTFGTLNQFFTIEYLSKKSDQYLLIFKSLSAHNISKLKKKKFEFIE